jgi:hypothetical protein
LIGITGMIFCPKGAAKWSQRKHSGTTRNFDGRLLNECACATVLSGSRKSSAYVAGFFTTGVIGWTRPVVLLREPASVTAGIDKLSAKARAGSFKVNADLEASVHLADPISR